MGHHLLLVSATNPGTTSLDIRRHVYDRLMEDSSFIGGWDDSMLFYTPVADYFSVGGAWSGYLVDEDRESLEDYGEDDDAQLITTDLYAKFLTDYVGLWIKRSEEEGPEFVDLDSEMVSETFIGRKWLVVVSWHS